MKNIILGVIIGLLIAIGGYKTLSWLEAKEQLDLSTLPSYSVAFDKEANATEVLAEALKKATKEQKNILLIAGGDWCRWCGTMSNFLEEHPKLQQKFYTEFEVLRVYYGKGINPSAKALIGRYGKPKGTPHFYVLDNQAELLQSFGTKSLERGYGYNPTKFLEFIEKYSKLKTITKDKK
jgi:thioredoxin-related protein